MKGSLVFSWMPNEDGVDLVVDIACKTLQTRIELVHGVSLPREFEK